MTFLADSLNIQDGKLWMHPELHEMVADITGDCPDTSDPLAMVAYLQSECDKLGGDQSTPQGQLNAVMRVELDTLKKSIEELIGGRTTSLLN